MTTTDQQRVAAYDIATRNDPRFDGQFYSAVLTTGIFCRPGCPGKPRAENVRFFSTAAAAAESGFRPCLRCHPESAPDPPEWRRTSPVVSRALRLIGEGILDDDGVVALSKQLSISSRQLQRLFVEELGAPPVAVAQTRRLLFAKKLIDETDLSMADIAFSAGYSSVRRFNEAIRQTYARTPSELRKKRRRSALNPNSGTIELKLFYRDPYNWPAMFAFLAERSTPLVETIDRNAYRRTIRVDGSSGVIAVKPLPTQRAVVLRAPSTLSRYLLVITERVKQMLDLKADPIAIDASLRHDPSLAPAIEAQPGIRLPGCWDGFEIAVRALLDRHSPEHSRELAARLVETFGDECRDSGDPALTRLFPTPDQLRAASLTSIGIDEAPATTIRALANAIVTGSLSLGGATSLSALSEQLGAIPGIDRHVIPYVALRVLGEPDLNLTGNQALFRHVSPQIPDDVFRRDMESRWGSYAAMYRWEFARSATLASV